MHSTTDTKSEPVRPWRSAHQVIAPISPADRLVFTVPEAGELLGVSRAFAYELIARGELPFLRLGRRVVVPKAALLKLVNQTTAGA